MCRGKSSHAEDKAFWEPERNLLANSEAPGERSLGAFLLISVG